MSTETSLRTYMQGLGDNLPHVFLVYGNREDAGSDIRAYLSEDRSISLEQNPDIFWFDSAQFSITQARSVSDIVSRRAVQAEQKFVIISTDAFTVEAQNALLKTIEDPDSATIFFLLVPEGAYVLETVESRSVVLRIDDKPTHFDINSFVGMSFQERISFFELFQYESEDKKVKYKKGELKEFLKSLELHISQEVLAGNRERQVYDDIAEMSAYVLDRSANVKQILEFVALRI